MATSNWWSSIFIGDAGRIEGCHLPKNVGGRLDNRDSQAGSGTLPQSQLQIDHRFKAKLVEHNR